MPDQVTLYVDTDKDHYAYKIGIDNALKPMESAMAHIWLVTDTNTRIDQLNAGRAYLRVNLAATAAGVGLHPHSQALQEYAEMQSLYEKVHEMLAPGGGRVQMLGALGYADPVSPMPRWPVDAKILKD